MGQFTAMASLLAKSRPWEARGQMLGASMKQMEKEQWEQLMYGGNHNLI